MFVYCFVIRSHKTEQCLGDDPSSDPFQILQHTDAMPNIEAMLELPITLSSHLHPVLHMMLPLQALAHRSSKTQYHSHRRVTKSQPKPTQRSHNCVFSRTRV